MIKERIDEKNSRETMDKGNRVVLLFNMVSAPLLFSRLNSVTWDVMPEETHTHTHTGRGREQQEHAHPDWRGCLKGHLPGGRGTE